MQELKTIKLGHGYMEPGIMPLSMLSTGDSSSISKQQPNTWGKHASLWGIPPTSPCSTASVRTNFHPSSSHSTSSKESLWASTQSSPISHPLGTNLWESPVSKLSQATLMSSGSSSSKDSSASSIWFTPPQVHSPNAMVTSTPNGKAPCDTWEVLRTPPMQKNGGETIPRLVRPQEISGSNGWISDLSKSSKDSVSSLWATPTTPPANTYNGAPYAPNSAGKAPLQTNHYAAKRFTPPQAVTHDSQNAANSCLQLFSDEFLNYLNMIN